MLIAGILVLIGSYQGWRGATMTDPALWEYTRADITGVNGDTVGGGVIGGIPRSGRDVRTLTVAFETEDGRTVETVLVHIDPKAYYDARITHDIFTNRPKLSDRIALHYDRTDPSSVRLRRPEGGDSRTRYAVSAGCLLAALALGAVVMRMRARARRA